MGTAKDPRSDYDARLDDFVRRIDHMGFPKSQRLDFPIWCVEDVKWSAVITEKLFRELQELGWNSTNLDPLERVLRARMAVISAAHAMSHRPSRVVASKILSSRSAR